MCSIVGRLGHVIGGLLLLAAVGCASGEPPSAASGATSDPPAAPAPTPTVGIEVPAAGARTTLPLHVLARVGQPGEIVRADLRWQDGTQLSQSAALLEVGGQGLLVASLDWAGPGSPRPSSQPAVLEVLDRMGSVLARQDVTVLSADDPEVESLTLFWVAGRRVQPAVRPVPRASDPAAMALDELLWGPGPADPPDLLTALPTVEDVLTYHGRQADWGPRVQLRGLTIADGIATADFSRELGAYGGGSTRVDLIEQQITRTLEQFPGIRSVRIAVEGTTRGVLEP